MMKNKLTKTAIFVALGVILPQILGHWFGIKGTYILPMHFCVVLTGILCGSLYAGISGIIILFFSFFLTGMPEAIMLPQLAVELVVLGGLTGFLYNKKSIYLSIILSYIAGRIAFSLVFIFLLPKQALYLALFQGLVGLVLQLIIIPLLIKEDKKENNENYKSVDSAKRKIKAGFSLVVKRGVKTLYTSKEFGIQPLLNVGYELRDTEVFDKIVGKAAAIVLVHYKAESVFADIISETAIEVFEKHKIKYEYNKKVPVVLNSDHTDTCPMEKLVKDVDNIEKGYKMLVDFVKKKAKN